MNIKFTKLKKELINIHGNYYTALIIKEKQIKTIKYQI